MRSRDENLALRALIAAVESNTESIRAMSEGVTRRLDMIDTKLDAVMGALTDHVNNGHGDAS